jgi:hypothetical protein
MADQAPAPLDASDHDSVGGEESGEESADEGFEDEPTFLVDAILGWNQNDRKYRVRWEDGQESWEPEERIVDDVRDMVEAYHRAAPAPAPAAPAPPPPPDEEEEDSDEEEEDSDEEEEESSGDEYVPTDEEEEESSGDEGDEESGDEQEADARSGLKRKAPGELNSFVFV